MREDKDFDLFWELCLVTPKELNVDNPVLDRQCNRPKFYEDGIAEPHFREDPNMSYCSIYYQCLDSAISTVTSRFPQQEYSLYVNWEQLFVKACSKIDYSAEYKAVTEFCGSDFSPSELSTQLEILSCMEITSKTDSLNFCDIYKHFQYLPKYQI